MQQTSGFESNDVVEEIEMGSDTEVVNEARVLDGALFLFLFLFSTKPNLPCLLQLFNRPTIKSMFVLKNK